MKAVISLSLMTLIAAAPSAPVAPVAAANSPPAPTAAAVPAPVPATQPSPEELHASAIELMRQGQFAKARVPLEKAYAATPTTQRTRPLILNRAIVDVVTKSNAMRAVRELGDYLKLHRDQDVAATDIFGAALNVAARDPRMKQGQLWQTAFKEWDRRNYELDNARPGYHRFGATWLDEQDYLDLQAKKKDSDQSIADQKDRVDRAAWNVGAARQRAEQAQADLNYYQRAVMDDAYLPTLSPADRLRGRARAGQPNAQLNDPILAQQGALAQSQGLSNQTSIATAQQVLNRAMAEYRQAVADQGKEQSELNRLASSAPKPDWPTKFDPVEISELKAPPLPPPDPKAAELAAKEKAKNAPAGWQGAFGDPGAPILPGAAGAAPVGGGVIVPATQPVAPDPSQLLTPLQRQQQQQQTQRRLTQPVAPDGSWPAR